MLPVTKQCHIEQYIADTSEQQLNDVKKYMNILATSLFNLVKIHCPLSRHLIWSVVLGQRLAHLKMDQLLCALAGIFVFLYLWYITDSVMNIENNEK